MITWKEVFIWVIIQTETETGVQAEVETETGIETEIEIGIETETGIGIDTGTPDIQVVQGALNVPVIPIVLIDLTEKELDL